jgi:uncharacterized protein (DUF58 family)
MTRRQISPRAVGWIVLGLTFIVAGSWSSRTPAGVALALTALVVALLADLVVVFRSSRAFDLTLVPLDDGDVNDEIRILVSARHRGRPMVVSLAGAPVTDRFVLRAPGTGILVFAVGDPGWFTHQDVDVMVVGPLGLIRSARRVRVPISPPLALGPPVFEHLFHSPPIRPVFAGPSPGSPRGHDLTRGVRPYVPGDNRRSVHWNATAHTGQLMVREREGSGAVRIRVIVVLTRIGPASVVTAGRANAFVRDFVGRGCQVELVTLESSGRSFGWLTKPYSPVARQVGVPPHRTVSAMITDLTQLRYRLAMLVIGPPAYKESSIPTRIITDTGDRWV